MFKMENKSEIVNNLLCMACLCVGRSIHEVKNEKLKKYYLETLNEIPLNKIGLIVPIICWECEAVLHKVVAFKEQVKDSYRILQTYTENLNECLLSDVSRTPRLRVHRNDPVDIPGDIVGEGTGIVRSEVNVSEYSDAEEPLQTFTSDAKKNRRKKKNSQNDKLAKHRIQNVEKLDVEMEDVKMELHDKDISTIKSNTEISRNGGMENILKVEEESENLNNKYFENINKVLEIQVDDVKTELDNKDESLAEDNIVSDSDLDIDNEIQSFLDDVKKNNKTKSKKKTVSNSIITLDLSYDEMQAERSKSMENESFLQAKFKCESCILVFNSSSSLKSHQAKKHAVKGDFICSICKTIISSVEAFTAHYKRHMRRYECPSCGKRTTDIKAMHRHIYTKHDVSLKKYQCNICGKVSTSLDTHRYHRDTHKARVECSQCDKTFSHRAGLMNHRLAVHELQNEFPCTVCNKVFRWKTSLKRHFEKHDNENKGENTQNRAFCTSCNIGFSSVCSLQRHLRNSLKHVTHDQLKFICDHCNQRFADKTKLRDHIEEKHLHRTFQCPICNKPSKNRVGLEQHIRAVHKGRPNNRMCHHCGKGFPTKVQLESHIRTHTGERPFMCEFCPTTFSQQSNLYKHHRQVHLNIKTKRYLCKKRKLEGSQTDTQFTLPIIQYLPDNEFILGAM